ncbi:MAG: cyclase family protein [Haloarculaceae archaeon]
MSDRPLAEVFADAPSNWGKWGEDDEVGAVNYLDETQVLRGVRAVDSGRTFSLGVPIGHPDGDPKTPGRPDTQHYMARDHGHYVSGKEHRDREGSDDVLIIPPHGTTHVDALGHSWYGDELYNGFDPDTTMGGLDRCSVEPIAEHGVVGRGVLLDVARHRGVDHLDRGEHISLDELRACADAQGVDLEPRDVLLIRTGWLERFYDGERDLIYEFDEPGITYSAELVEWFDEMEIPSFVTDTLANEQTHSEMGLRLPLHATFIRDLGILFTEIALLSELAADCADDGRYDFLFVCSPLKVVHGTGSPVNPLAIK